VAHRLWVPNASALKQLLAKARAKVMLVLKSIMLLERFEVERETIAGNVGIRNEGLQYATKAVVSTDG